MSSVFDMNSRQLFISVYDMKDNQRHCNMSSVIYTNSLQRSMNSVFDMNALQCSMSSVYDMNSLRVLSHTYHVATKIIGSKDWN